MHPLALALAPVIAAEKSKVPFYIAGGVLVAWALIVALALGLRRGDFPGDLRSQRAVGAISVLLVIAALTTAVATSGSPGKATSATAAPASTTPAPSATAPSAPSPRATSPSASGPTSTAPSAPPAPAASSLKLAADPSGQLRFDTPQLKAGAGKVSIAFTNASPLEHNVTIAQGGKVLGATPTFTGGSKTLTLTLKPGTYTFYCSVPGHRQAGMEGTLTIS